MRTPSAPATTVCAQYNPVRRRSPGSRRTVLKPANASWASFCSPGETSREGGASARIRTTFSAEKANVPAVIANTTSTLVDARKMPPSAGPAKDPTAAIVLWATLAAVSSSGVRETVGRSAACAGRKVVERMVTQPASAYTISAGSEKAATSAAATSATARDTSAKSITRSRRKRSVSTAAKGAINAAGTTRIRETIPTAVAPPVRYANTDTATTYIHLPVSEPAQAISIRRRLGFEKTARNALRDSESRSLSSPATCGELHFLGAAGKIRPWNYV